MTRFSDISNSTVSGNSEVASPLIRPGQPLDNTNSLAGFSPEPASMVQTTPVFNAPADSLPQAFPKVEIVDSGNEAIAKDISNTVSNLAPEMQKLFKVTSISEADPKQTAKSDAKEPANFVIAADGSVRMPLEPKLDGSGKVVIEIDSPPGANSLSKNQREALATVVSQISEKVKAQAETLAAAKIGQSTPADTISDALADKGAPASDIPGDASSNYSVPNQEAMQQQEQFKPGTSGAKTYDQISGLFPKREGEPLSDESQEVYNLKNAVAGLFNPEKDDPYVTERQVPGLNGLAIGRYGLASNNFLDWLGIPDINGLSEDGLIEAFDKLAKRGKIPKELAAKMHDKAFASKFIANLQKLAKGEKLTPAELKETFPAALQERVATDLLGKNLKEANGDVGKAALAMHLNKTPRSLTPEELNSADNKLYTRAVGQLSTISRAGRDMRAGDTMDYQVSTDGSSMKAQIARAGVTQAESMGTAGHCAEGVQLALAKVGIHKEGTGDGWGMKDSFLNDPHWRVTNNPAKASICFREWSPEVRAENGGKDYGHVALLHVENGQLIETSDHKTVHDVNNSRYSKTIYMEYIG